MLLGVKRSELSPRILKLFDEAERVATRLAEIASEERGLQRSAEVIWQEKAQVMALLADAARKACVAESTEMLKRTVRRPPTKESW
jgi:hypothetical protein